MIRTFSDFNEFQSAARELGIEVDLQALTVLDTLFFETYKNYLIINARDHSENPNNLLILSKENNLFYGQKQFTSKDYKMFRLSLRNPFGESTVLAFLALQEVMNNYSTRFESLHNELDEAEKKLDVDKLDSLSRAFRKLADRLEDFLDLLIKLEDRKFQQVRTNYISYDYDVLLAKTRHLLDRSRNQLGRISGLRNELEIKETRKLNERISNLTLVMKRLTALTVILMIPTIITSHYGMNFPAPEFQWEYGYLFATVLSLVIMFGVVVFFKKKDWL